MIATPPAAAGSAARRSAAGCGASMREALAQAVAVIAAAGCESPCLDAELLLAHVLEVTRAQLLTEDERRLGARQAELFGALVRRRASEREPVAYLLGRRAFRHIELAVDPRVLIPRPETELLVESALALPRATHVLDLGTGSGAIALALKHERPDLHVSASDVSAEALALAAANGRRLGLEVQWRHADLLDGLDEEFEVILANLPYVPDRERASLAAEIVRHEPAAALFAGADGLACIRALLLSLRGRAGLRMLAVEVGAGQAARVGCLVRAAGFDAVRFERDLAGIERVVIAERRRRWR